jgi:hypothetical protein
MSPAHPGAAALVIVTKKCTFRSDSNSDPDSNSDAYSDSEPCSFISNSNSDTYSNSDSCRFGSNLNSDPYLQINSHLFLTFVCHMGCSDWLLRFVAPICCCSDLLLRCVSQIFVAQICCSDLFLTCLRSYLAT